MQNYTMGIELGSTRIKGVIISADGEVVAKGGYSWENKLENGYWTYCLDEVKSGLKACFIGAVEDFKKNHGFAPVIDKMGVSAMMHGYIALSENDELLVPFRTWRNMTCERASAELTQKLNIPIPQRWTCSHFYTAVLNREEHIKRVKRVTTLAGYVHYLLTDKFVLSVGDASGVFPVKDGEYDKARLTVFNDTLRQNGYEGRFEDLVPTPLACGKEAGRLTSKGVELLGGEGIVSESTRLCPPEGDVQTGMVATGCARVGQVNVSAGTSAFVVAITEPKEIEPAPVIGVMVSPDNNQLVMANVNNCTCDVNAWSGIFSEVLGLYGVKTDMGELLGKLFETAKQSDKNAGGLTAYNFLSGEPVVGLNEGRPTLVRNPSGEFNLANFMQTLLYSPLCTLAMGMKQMVERGVSVREVCGHGGFFKSGEIAQAAMSAALKAPVSVYETAGEGGAWGIALLAQYLDENCSLGEFVERIFKKSPKTTVKASKAEQERFDTVLERYANGLEVARLAVEKFY